VAGWEKQQRAAGYAESSIRGRCKVLHLADVVDEGLREANPATRRRGRGKRGGQSWKGAPEKTITAPLGILLVAEPAGRLRTGAPRSHGRVPRRAAQPHIPAELGSAQPTASSCAAGTSVLANS
jgi:hypothetical protein